MFFIHWKEPPHESPSFRNQTLVVLYVFDSVNRTDSLESFIHSEIGQFWFYFMFFIYWKKITGSWESFIQESDYIGCFVCFWFSKKNTFIRVIHLASHSLRESDYTGSAVKKNRFIRVTHSGIRLHWFCCIFLLNEKNHLIRVTHSGIEVHLLHCMFLIQ